MAATKLIPYEFRVRAVHQNDEDDYWDLSDFSQNTLQARLDTPDNTTPFGGATDFIDLTDDFCTTYQPPKYKEFEDSPLSNVTLAVSQDYLRAEQYAEGRLYLGNSGSLRSILNRKTGERDENGLGLDDATERPTYFLFYISPAHRTKGYLIVERSPRYGVKMALQRAFRQWLNNTDHASTIDIEMERVPTKEIFSEMREADKAVRLRFKRDGSPKQIHDRFDRVFETEEMSQATEFRATSGGDMGLVVDELETWHNEGENVFENLNGQKYKNVKITVEENGSEATISLTKGEMNMRKNIDLNEITNEGDLPALPEISSRAHSYLRTVVGYDTDTGSLF